MDVIAKLILVILVILYMVGYLYNNNIEKKISKSINKELVNSDLSLLKIGSFIKSNNVIYVNVKLVNIKDKRIVSVIYRIEDDLTVTDVTNSDETFNIKLTNAEYSNNYFKLKYNLNIH